MQQATIETLLPITKGLRVLLVDDSCEFGKTMQEFMSTVFAEVAVAKNGKEALALFENGSFDIVISDIMMPVMNGIELLKTLKSRDFLQKVIIITAQNDCENIMQAIDCGVDGFFAKPFNLDKLLNVIYSVAEPIALRRRLR